MLIRVRVASAHALFTSPHSFIHTLSLLQSTLDSDKHTVHWVQYCNSCFARSSASYFKLRFVEQWTALHWICTFVLNWTCASASTRTYLRAQASARCSPRTSVRRTRRTRAPSASTSRALSAPLSPRSVNRCMPWMSDRLGFMPVTSRSQVASQPYH